MTGQADTKVRYEMVALATGAAVLLYLDRVCVSTAAETMARDLKISRPELDDVLAVFFLSYALAQVPAGWLGDRFGSRWTLAAYTLLWSFVTGLLGFATGLARVFILRLLCGVFQAGAYPVAAGVVRNWIPMDHRGRASSVIAVGGRLGGWLAPILTMQLMLLWTHGVPWSGTGLELSPDASSWRPVMMVYGGAGIVYAILLVWRFRDKPEAHTRANQQEWRLITASQSRILDSPDGMRLPVRGLLVSRSMWMNCAVQFAANLGWAFLVTKLPQYLKDVHRATDQQLGWLQGIPQAAGIVGMFAGGWFTDSMTSRFGLRWGRSAALSVSRGDCRGRVPEAPDV